MAEHRKSNRMKLTDLGEARRAMAVELAKGFAQKAASLNPDILTPDEALRFAEEARIHGSAVLLLATQEPSSEDPYADQLEQVRGLLDQIIGRQHVLEGAVAELASDVTALSPTLSRVEAGVSGARVILEGQAMQVASTPVAEDTNGVSGGDDPVPVGRESRKSIAIDMLKSKVAEQAPACFTFDEIAELIIKARRDSGMIVRGKGLSITYSILRELREAGVLVAGEKGLYHTPDYVPPAVPLSEADAEVTGATEEVSLESANMPLAETSDILSGDSVTEVELKAPERSGGIFDEFCTKITELIELNGEQGTKRADILPLIVEYMITRGFVVNKSNEGNQWSRFRAKLLANGAIVAVGEKTLCTYYPSSVPEEKRIARYGVEADHLGGTALQASTEIVALEPVVGIAEPTAEVDKITDEDLNTAIPDDAEAPVTDIDAPEDGNEDDDEDPGDDPDLIDDSELDVPDRRMSTVEQADAPKISRTYSYLDVKLRYDKTGSVLTNSEGRELEIAPDHAFILKELMRSQTRSNLYSLLLRKCQHEFSPAFSGTDLYNSLRSLDAICADLGLMLHREGKQDQTISLRKGIPAQPVEVDAPSEDSPVEEVSIPADQVTEAIVNYAAGVAEYNEAVDPHIAKLTVKKASALLRAILDHPKVSFLDPLTKTRINVVFDTIENPEVAREVKRLLRDHLRASSVVTEAIAGN